MPETPVPPQLLDDLIERRLAISPGMGEAAALARLAYDCRGLTVAGPGPEAGARMRARFSATMDRDGRRGFVALLGGGMGARPLRHKVAAAALALTVAGGATSYTTGISPLEAADSAAGFMRSVVVNMMPNGSSESEGAVTPEATPSPMPTVTQSPGSPAAAAGSPAATETPSTSPATPETTQGREPPPEKHPPSRRDRRGCHPGAGAEGHREAAAGNGNALAAGGRGDGSFPDRNGRTDGFALAVFDSGGGRTAAR